MSTCDLHGARPGRDPKTAYRSSRAADAALQGIRKRGRSRDNKKPNRAYLCEGCGRWFLTSQPE